MSPPNRKKAAERHLNQAHAALREAEIVLAASQFEGAVNRAYSCGFHAVRAALAMAGVQPKTHRGLNERLSLDLVVPGKIEARFLIGLRRLQFDRELADEAVDQEITAERATVDLDVARRILERMSQFVENEEE